MIDLSKGMNFEQYLDKNNESQREALLNAFERTELSKDTVDFVKSIKETVNIVIYSEGYCPDCVATLPFIKRMKDINDNINVSIFGLSGNEQLLEEYTGTSRIPTVMFFKENMEPKGVYIEIPKALLEKMVGMPSDRQKELIADYRAGKYNDLIEEELVGILK